MGLHFAKDYLSNGLCVIAHRDPALRTAQVFLGYNVGSCHEKPGITGLAHLLEHLMFEGTPQFPDFDKIIQEAGGASNAFTGQDFTCYYESLPDENLEVALALEADRMQNTALTDEKIEIQRKVVLEEFKERYINNPYGDVWHLLRELCFRDHPYEWPVIGRTLEEVASLTPHHIRTFHKTYYRPDRAVLSVASRRPEQEIIELAKRYFEGNPGNSIDFKELKDAGTTPPPLHEASGCARKHVKRHVPDALIYLCWHTPPVNTDEAILIDLLAEWLGGSESSPLYQRLVREQQFFTALQAYHLEGALGGLFVISGRLARATTFQEAEDTILDIVQEVRTVTPDSDRLERVKSVYKTTKAFALVKPSERAERLLWFQMLWGDAALEKHYDLMLSSATPAHLKISAETYLHPERAHILAYESTPGAPKNLHQTAADALQG